MTEISNLKKHEQGIYTFTHDNKWTSFTSCGWGNGYIAIPLDHPFLQDLSPKKIEIYKGYSIDVSYETIPEIKDQEWTYSIMSKVEGLEGIFYIFGFDTLHSGQNKENWPESRVVATIESYVPEVLNTN